MKLLPNVRLQNANLSLDLQAQTHRQSNPTVHRNILCFTSEHIIEHQVGRDLLAVLLPHNCWLTSISTAPPRTSTATNNGSLSDSLITAHTTHKKSHVTMDMSVRNALAITNIHVY